MRRRVTACVLLCVCVAAVQAASAARAAPRLLLVDLDADTDAAPPAPAPVAAPPAPRASDGKTHPLSVHVEYQTSQLSPSQQRDVSTLVTQARRAAWHACRSAGMHA